MANKPHQPLDQRLIVLLSRVKDATLIADFGATQRQLDDARLALGIPESSSRVDSMTFAMTWQRSSSVLEAAIRLGMTRQAALGRASLLRLRKVPLKEMPRQTADFWDAVRLAVEEEDGNAQNHK